MVFGSAYNDQVLSIYIKWLYSDRLILPTCSANGPLEEDSRYLVLIELYTLSHWSGAFILRELVVDAFLGILRAPHSGSTSTPRIPGVKCIDTVFDRNMIVDGYLSMMEELILDAYLSAAKLGDMERLYNQAEPNNRFILALGKRHNATRSKGVRTLAQLEHVTITFILG